MKQLQFRRYANTALNTITGLDGEIIVDETNKTLTVHDGVTPGGTALATQAFANSAYATANIANNFIYSGGNIGISSNNNVNISGSSSGNAVSISGVGTDTDIDIKIQPKGIGYVQFGQYTPLQQNTSITATGYINIKSEDGIIYKLLVSV
jgi:Major tropism determinant N-terminal domain